MPVITRPDQEGCCPTVRKVGSIPYVVNARSWPSGDHAGNALRLGEGSRGWTTAPSVATVQVVGPGDRVAYAI